MHFKAVLGRSSHPDASPGICGSTQKPDGQQSWKMSPKAISPHDINMQLVFDARSVECFLFGLIELDENTLYHGWNSASWLY
jgi:hypothetical protein